MLITLAVSVFGAQISSVTFFKESTRSGVVSKLVLYVLTVGSHLSSQAAVYASFHQPTA